MLRNISSGDSDLSFAVDPSLFSTKIIMDGGHLNNVDENVLDVKFLTTPFTADNSTNSPPNVDRGNFDPTLEERESEGASSPWYLLAVVGSFMLFGGYFVQKQRRGIQENRRRRERRGDDLII